MRLRTGDKVFWTIGLLARTKIVGVVIEEYEEGTVHVLTHTKNGVASVADVEIDRSKLTLIIQ